MELGKGQKRFLKSKTMGVQVLKGNLNTGKTTIAVDKMIIFENNYCLYDEDSILYVTSDSNRCDELRKLYKKINDAKAYEVMTLFSTNKNRIKVLTKAELIEMYAKTYIKEQRMSLRIASEEERLDILRNILSANIEKYKKSKLLKKITLEFLLEEIHWIKSSCFEEEEYLNIERKGRSKRIKKNAISRKAIFDMMLQYSEGLAYEGLMDEYDYTIYAIRALKKYRQTSTHIFLDDSETLRRGEIKFIKMLNAQKPYSNFIVIINTNTGDIKDAWFKKGVNFNSVFGDTSKVRTYLLKDKFSAKNNSKFLEKFKFVDLKHKNTMEFMRDSSDVEGKLISYTDKDTEDIYEGNEQFEIPVFSDIAAGEPILMSSQMESTFMLPNDWIRDKKELFLLHVKGDSMKNADILDGDFILIKRQSTANHNDIIAADIDGSATLKRLKLSEEPVLMPENPMYSPIHIKNKNVNILGVAVGILKKNI
ncbi:transcriptional repressor LexA [Inconstantimicrobium mannanitabidum]|uniref:ATPase n=1 Tax=Inconstantimicrobium mannanitabidum TaxID=1604901 RepID=A0ACB5R7V0_9CLOT|nr:transcriptional repressor LexA [Clostridium sp. TW13]GKX65089.1 ATPase [Clostridium sp. TW13]